SGLFPGQRSPCKTRGPAACRGSALPAQGGGDQRITALSQANRPVCCCAPALIEPLIARHDPPREFDPPPARPPPKRYAIAPKSRPSGDSMSYVFTPPAQAALPVAGTDARFPVNRVYCVGR